MRERRQWTQGFSFVLMFANASLKHCTGKDVHLKSLVLVQQLFLKGLFLLQEAPRCFAEEVDQVLH